MGQTEKIIFVFDQLRADRLHILDSFYAKDVTFVDPLGEHKGIEEVKQYYKRLYENVKEIHFESKDMVSQGDTHVYVWKMKLIAKGLNKGNMVTVEGNSILKFNAENLVIYHRDYFDMDEFLYRHIPILNNVTNIIKKKLKGK